MYQFFTREDFSTKQLDYSAQTYKVGVGEGVILQANDDYKNVLTKGLRTCVVFALINPVEHSTLLIHFFSQAQIKNDLNKLVSSFIKQATGSELELVCLIAGGRAFNDSSEGMCDQLIKYAKEELLEVTTSIKLEINAPIVADDSETLSLLINLETGKHTMSLVSGDESNEISEPSLNRIDFIDLRDNKSVAPPLQANELMQGISLPGLSGTQL